MLEWVKPIAGPIAFPRLKTGQDVHEFVVDVVDQQSTLLSCSRLEIADGWLMHGRTGSNSPRESVSGISEFYVGGT